MTVRDIRLFGDPILRQESREVTAFDAHLRRLATDMLETMRDAPGVGLAAPQVGVLKRLFTWEIVFEEEEEDGATTTEGGAVVNPVLLDQADEQQRGEEGCLSFPGLFFPLERPRRATVRWQDLTGEERVTEVDGFTARVWLHEMDHLDGILFIDHLARHDRQDALRRMREQRLADEEDDRSGDDEENLLLRNLPS